MLRRCFWLACGLLGAACVGEVADGAQDEAEAPPGLAPAAGKEPGAAQVPEKGSVGPGAPGPAGASCSGAGLVPQRVRKITDEQYVRLVGALLPGVAPNRVATPGTESALIKDADEFVVRGPLASQYW